MEIITVNSKVTDLYQIPSGATTAISMSSTVTNISSLPSEVLRKITIENPLGLEEL